MLGFVIAIAAAGRNLARNRSRDGEGKKKEPQVQRLSPEQVTNLFRVIAEFSWQSGF